MRRLFWFLFVLILLLTFVVRIIPSFGDNFYFTVDQGNDAVHVRETVERGRLWLRGTETGIAGVYAGPLWYYFLAIGYFLFDGHPFGGLLMVILLNTALVGWLMIVITRKLSWKWGLFVGFALQFSWFFYDTSRWAFNPFPLVACSWVLVYLLTRFLEGKERYFYLGIVPVAMAFNAEVAGAFAMLVFYGLFGLWALFSGKLRWKPVFFVGAFSLLFIVPLGLSFAKKFYLTRISGSEVPGLVGTFSGTSFGIILQEFWMRFSWGIVPQSGFLSVLLVAFVGWFFWRNKKKNIFVARFLWVVGALMLVSYLFFASNKGFRDWHTVYVAPLVSLSFLLVVSQIKREVAGFALAVFLVAQGWVFGERYMQYMKPSADASMLANEIKIVDWIYQNAENDGFNVYTYTSTYFDYHYQYVFWWYGGKKYKYMPCEYSNFPLSHKVLYVPGWEAYTEPKLGCNRLRFLIVESDTNGQENRDWIDKFREETRLVDTYEMGDVVVEKRAVK